MRRLLRLASLGAAAIVVGGCTLPLPVSVASWALDGVSYLTTNKSLTDHGLSMIMGEDCAKHRIMTDGDICETAPVVGPVLVEDTTAPAPEITVAELAVSPEDAQPVNDPVNSDVVAPAAVALAAIDVPPAADPMVASLEIPEENFALAFAAPTDTSVETAETAGAFAAVDVTAFETAAGPTESVDQGGKTDETAEIAHAETPVEAAPASVPSMVLAQFQFAAPAPFRSVEANSAHNQTAQAEAPVAPGPAESSPVTSAKTAGETFDPDVYAPAHFEPEAVEMAEIPKAPDGIEVASTAPVDFDPPVAAESNREFEGGGLPPAAFEPAAVKIATSDDAEKASGGAGTEMAAVRDFLTKMQAIFSAPDPDVTIAAAQPDGSLTSGRPPPDAAGAAQKQSGGAESGTRWRFDNDLGPNMVPDQPPELG